MSAILNGEKSLCIYLFLYLNRIFPLSPMLQFWAYQFLNVHLFFPQLMNIIAIAILLPWQTHFHAAFVFFPRFLPILLVPFLQAAIIVW